MKQKTFLKTSGIVFLIVGLAHLWRALSDLPVLFGMIPVPVWLSWVAVVALFYLSYEGLRSR